MLFFASSKLGVLVEVMEVINVVAKVKTSSFCCSSSYSRSSHSNSVVDIVVVVVVVVVVAECH